MRKMNLKRLLARRPDGIFVSDFEQATLAPTCSVRLASSVSKVWCRSVLIGRIALAHPRTGSRSYGAADGEGCGTLGALSNDTNGAPHVATF